MDSENEEGGNRPLSKQDQDREDLHRERSGSQASRMSRFFPKDAAPDPKGKQAEQKERTLSRLLTLLQTNAAYAKLYNETMDRLREAERAAAEALRNATQTAQRADQDLASAQAGASTLRDGTRVYRDAEGKARTEDGREVTGDELEAIIWREGAVSYEEFLARRKAAEEARQAIDEIRRYQVDVLGNARDRLTDEENPPSEAELGEINDRIQKKIPEAILDENADTAQPDNAAPGTVNVKIPDLGS